MNLVSIRCFPRFYLNLTLQEVELIKEIGKQLSDFECKQAVIQGGFIYAWKHSLSTNKGTTFNQPTVTATFSELDMVLRILEERVSLPADKRIMADKMKGHIKSALLIANEQLRKIEFEVVEYTVEERIKRLKTYPLADDGSHYETVEDLLDDYHIPQYGLKT